MHSQYILGHALTTFAAKISKTLAVFGDSLLSYLKWAEKGNVIYIVGLLFDIVLKVLSNYILVQNYIIINQKSIFITLEIM